MKNINLMRSLAAVFVLLFGFAALFAGCSKDEPTGDAAVSEGVVFRFERKALYKTGVNEIGSVKITLVKGTEKIVLPSSTLSGNADQVVTKPFALPAGEYSITGYIAYDQGHNYLFEVDLIPTNEDITVKTTFTVEPAAITTFPVPVKTREVLNQNFIRNALMGVCQEVFGDDQSIWPWDPKKYPYPDWEGLEFEMDDYGNPLYLASIYFNGVKDGKPTVWQQMTAIPDGTLSRIITIQGIVCTDLPNLRQIPSDLYTMPEFGTLTLIDTGIETLPESLGQIKSLNTLAITNCNIKEVPKGIENLEDLRVLHLRNNQITRFDTPLAKLTKLESVDLSGNPLESIGEGVFTAAAKLAELKLMNTNLSALPAGIGNLSVLRGIYLSNSRFTSIPSVLKSHTGIRALYLDGNPISSVSTSDFVGMTNLDDISLARIQLGTLPRLNIPKLIGLDITNCGLTSVPDLSGLPELRSLRMGANKFTTIPAGYFTNNLLMRILVLSDSPQFTTVGSADLGLKAKYSDTQDGFKWLEVVNCPSLQWTTPADWKCLDGHENTNPGSKPVQGIDTRRPDFEPGNPNIYFGRVAVLRKGSPGVQFGK